MFLRHMHGCVNPAMPLTLNSLLWQLMRIYSKYWLYKIWFHHLQNDKSVLKVGYEKQIVRTNSSAMRHYCPRRKKLRNSVKRRWALYPRGEIGTVQFLKATVLPTGHYRILANINAGGHVHSYPFAQDYHTHHSNSPVGSFCTRSVQAATAILQCIGISHSVRGTWHSCTAEGSRTSSAAAPS